MRLELRAAGHDVQFVSINAISADSNGDRKGLLGATSYPLLQDKANIDVWQLHHFGKKDDFFIYDRGGKLADYLPVNGERDTVLSGKNGYKVVKNAILDVVEGK